MTSVRAYVLPIVLATAIAAPTGLALAGWSRAAAKPPQVGSVQPSAPDGCSAGLCRLSGFHNEIPDSYPCGERDADTCWTDPTDGK